MPRASDLASKWRREVAFPLSAAAVLLADQLTKLWAKSALASNPLPPNHYIVRLTYVENEGAAFGLLTNEHLLMAFTAVMVIATIVIYYRYPYWGHPVLKTGLGLVLGGAVGNLIDRLRLGFVVDFIDFRVWPVFNLADSAITIGVTMLAFYFLFLAKSKPASS
jgi:signal peptidase II